MPEKFKTLDPNLQSTIKVCAFHAVVCVAMTVVAARAVNKINEPTIVNPE